jgi:hypothetical protein
MKCVKEQIPRRIETRATNRMGFSVNFHVTVFPLWNFLMRQYPASQYHSNGTFESRIKTAIVNQSLATAMPPTKDAKKSSA